MKSSSFRPLVILALASASASAQNLVSNPGFDTNPWLQATGAVSWSSVDSSDSPDSGSTQFVVNAAAKTAVMRQCITGIRAGRTYGFGANYRIPASQDPLGRLTMTLYWSEHADCFRFDPFPMTKISEPTRNGWGSFHDSRVAPSNARAAVLELGAILEAPDGSFTAFFDDSYVVLREPCSGAPATYGVISTGLDSGCFTNCLASEFIHLRLSPGEPRDCDVVEWRITPGPTIRERRPKVMLARGTYAVRATVTGGSGETTTEDLILLIAHTSFPPKPTARLLPEVQTLGTGERGSLTVHLLTDYPQEITIGLRATPSDIVEIPLSARIPPGSRSVTVPMIGMRTGHAGITATFPSDFKPAIETTSVNVVASTCRPPTLFSQPRTPLQGTYGESLTLSADVRGSWPMSFQWFEVVPGQSPTALDWDARQVVVTKSLTQSMSVIVRAANACGSSDAGPIQINVDTPPRPRGVRN